MVVLSNSLGLIKKLSPLLITNKGQKEKRIKRTNTQGVRHEYDEIINIC